MNQRILLFLSLAVMMIPEYISAQNIKTGNSKTKLEVYYFHPNERCPIDQSIEDNTRKLMQSEFTREIKDGTIIFKVLNTDEKANAKIVSNFEMNAQALYLVTFSNGKEIKTDFTEFAFSCSQNNPVKFKSRLKDEILRSIK